MTLREFLRKRLPHIFVALTFGWTWSLLGPAALAKYGIGSATVSNGVRNLASFAPTLVAILLIAADDRKQGLLGLWRAIVTRHIPLWSTICAFVLPQLTCLIAFTLLRIFGGTVPTLDDWQWLCCCTKLPTAPERELR